MKYLQGILIALEVIFGIVAMVIIIYNTNNNIPLISDITFFQSMFIMTAAACGVVSIELFKKTRAEE